jgi:hypothetical protein
LCFFHTSCFVFCRCQSVYSKFQVPRLGTLRLRKEPRVGRVSLLLSERERLSAALSHRASLALARGRRLEAILALVLGGWWTSSKQRSAVTKSGKRALWYNRAARWFIPRTHAWGFDWGSSPPFGVARNKHRRRVTPGTHRQQQRLAQMDLGSSKPEVLPPRGAFRPTRGV